MHESSSPSHDFLTLADIIGARPQELARRVALVKTYVALKLPSDVHFCIFIRRLFCEIGCSARKASVRGVKFREVP